MEFEGLAEGWEVWTAQKRRAVLAYRPDVFDSAAFPAECMPALYLTKGRRGRRPGRPDPPPDAPWYLTLYLEPDVSDRRSFDTRADALDGTLELAARFDAGDVDYHDLYQVPREAYLERLGELTGDR